MGLTIEGRKFNIPGVGVMLLFPISKLSQALVDANFPRDPQTLRLWIKKGILPRPLFTNPADLSRPKGLWTKEQIDLIVKTVRECGLRQGSAEGMDMFKELIHSRMKKLNHELYIGKE